jgi:hypothetical protein
VNELLDRWLEVIDIERKTRTGYVGKIEKHVRPTIGRLQVGRVRANTIEGLYAQLRRCRDRCRGEKFVSTALTATTHATSTPLGGSAPRSLPGIRTCYAVGASGPAHRIVVFR